MDNIKKRRITTWLVSGLAGLIVALLYLAWLNQSSPMHSFMLVFVFFYLWGLFGLVLYCSYTFFISPRLSSFSKQWKIVWIIICFLAGVWLTNNIPLSYLDPPGGLVVNPIIYQVLFIISGGFSIGFLLFLLSIFFVTQPIFPKVIRSQTRWKWLVYATPIILIWLFYLLMYWPGMMSSDSLDQWGQMLSGQYFNHHPAFHTFTIWFFTRFYMSPASVAIAQFVALGLLVGAILAFLEKQGVPSWILWVAGLVMAVSPVNGVMVNTLWKDIPYSTALLGLTFLVLHLAFSKGQWISSWKNWILFGVVASLVCLFRQNGLAIVLCLFLLVIVVYHRYWKYVAGAIIVALALYLGMTGPVYQWVGVQDSTVLLDSSTSLYTIAENSEPGSATDQLLRTIQPFNHTWQCSISTDLSLAYAPGTTAEPVQEVANLVRFSPNLLSYFYRCERPLVWIIQDPYAAVYNTSQVHSPIDPNSYGLVFDSKFPKLESSLTDFLLKTMSDVRTKWILWRPAIYLYAFLFVIGVQVCKQKNAYLFLVCAPILLQSVESTFLLIMPNFRYHYAAVLIAMSLWPLLFLPNRENQPNNAGRQEYAVNELNS